QVEVLTGPVDDPLIDAFVAAAGEHQVIGAGEVLGDALVEHGSGGTGHDERRLGAVGVVGRLGAAVGRIGDLREVPGAVGEDVFEGQRPGFGLHHHARSPTVGRVVDGVVPVEGEVAQIVDVQAQLSAVDGLADQRQLQTGEVVGEDRDDVDGHLRTSRLGGGRFTEPRLGG